MFLSPMSISHKNAKNVTLASCVLHNYLLTKIQMRYTPNGSSDNVHSENETVQPGLWRSKGVTSWCNLFHQE